MGLGIHVAGKVPRKGLLRRRSKSRLLLSEIEGALESAIDDPIQRRLTSCDRSNDALIVRLHPGEEDVNFTIEGSRLVASAKTSSAGPGYHAMLVDLLDEIGTRSGIEWDWNTDEADETGFHEHRDFEGLRETMLDWLTAMAGHLLEAEREGGSGISICLPIGDSPVGDHFSTTPMGPMSRDWWRAVADGNDAERVSAGIEFFTAWCGPEDPSYWANVGRYLMMWELDWTRPANEDERARYETALGCYARARQMAPEIDLPEAELKEAWNLLNGADPDAPPRPGGLGYRRGMMERPLMGSWWIHLPGYFRRQTETGERGSVVYWFGPREIHVTTYSLATSNDGTTGESYVRRKAAAAEVENAPFRPARDWLVGHAELYGVEDGIRTIQAMLGTGLRLCLVTILHEDTPEGGAWARSTLESIYCPPAD